MFLSICGCIKAVGIACFKLLYNLLLLQWNYHGRRHFHMWKSMWEWYFIFSLITPSYFLPTHTILLFVILTLLSLRYKYILMNALSKKIYIGSRVKRIGWLINLELSHMNLMNNLRKLPSYCRFNLYYGIHNSICSL